MISIIAIVCFTVLLESSLNALRRWLRRKGFDVFVAVINKITGELMILGLISFFVLMGIEFFSDNAWVASNIIMFEIAHVWIFVVGILFGVLAVIWMTIATSYQQRWLMMDHAPAEQIMASMMSISGRDQTRYGRCINRVCGVSFWQSNQSQLVEFQLFREFFLAKHGARVVDVFGKLASSRARAHTVFRFGRYLNRFSSEKIEEQMEVAAGSWLFWVVMLLAGAGINATVTTGYSRNSLRTTMLIFSWVALAVVIAMVIIMRGIRLWAAGSASTVLGFSPGTPMHEVVRTLTIRNMQGKFADVAKKKKVPGRGYRQPSPLTEGGGVASALAEHTWEAGGGGNHEHGGGGGGHGGGGGKHGGGDGGGRVRRVILKVKSKIAIARQSTSDFDAAISPTSDAERWGEVDDAILPGLGSLQRKRLGSLSKLTGGRFGKGRTRKMIAAVCNCTPMKRVRFFAYNIPRISERFVLFQLCILAYIFIVGLPEGLGMRKGLNYAKKEGHDSVGGVLVYVVLSALPNLLSLLVLQPFMLKDIIMVQSIVGEKHELLHVLHEERDRMSRENRLHDMLINLVEQHGGGKADFLFEQEDIAKTVAKPNLQRWASRAHWVDVTTVEDSLTFREAVASRLHDLWRSKRKVVDDGRREPRIKVVEHVSYDIANLSFVELPPQLQQSNTEASDCACALIELAVKQKLEFGDEFYDWAAAKQHEHWCVVQLFPIPRRVYPHIDTILLINLFFSHPSAPLSSHFPSLRAQ